MTHMPLLKGTLSADISEHSQPHRQLEDCLQATEDPSI